MLAIPAHWAADIVTVVVAAGAEQVLNIRNGSRIKGSRL
jgi:hypothetical protein